MLGSLSQVCSCHKRAIFISGALIDAHTFITYEKQIRNLHLQEARLSRRRDKEVAELRRLQAERTQKQQTHTPSKRATDKFVFSTREIEPLALPTIP
jgi:cell division protein FtsL